VSTSFVPSLTNNDQLTTSAKEKKEEANTPSTEVVKNDVPPDLQPMNRRSEEKLQTVDV
ncbi:unnamed protein product, partial [Symbiodinium pilosum]